MPKHGKRYREAAAKVDKSRLYGVDEAIALAKEIHPAKFDETVELHIKTGLDPRHAEQQIRGSTVLPHGLGKVMRVLVFAEGDAAAAAREAGADFVGSDDLIKQIEGGFLDFDVAIATREMMGKVGRLGRILGPRGLMPNPRSGTVVGAEDIAKSVQEAKQGRVEFRLDRLANIHVPLGKVSFEDRKLKENMAALIEAVNAAKPKEAKGQYIRSATLTTTMGPGIHLDLAQTLSLKLT
ncbi:50S ribosomal protein L1 [Tepidiforma flava]|jgi:large subunit ribosomal protein L1|uniref:Large ribosomal subunit protein uL1 n=1 Tax=Tepidiforma flava TaxID=3004094 RepID=A0ABY7M4Q8_9CHLR|nr:MULTISPECIES: 50S ribosomal protein L1 [Tepidiforma]MCX7618818.1 50S ribosomal protein L1 [Tepidiforma sp.]WBL35525.1 50S ribosomal protein L1 [Tepidiforma flava]GIW16979.1 MAG: 50S ribosomal protein L1 [Tepidiforma sp.]